MMTIISIIEQSLNIFVMYIDSPQFPRRKVVADKNQPVGGFGFERLQLANYVADELNNNHRDDAAILQKFRKQAEQYKRNLLRRKHQPPELSSQPTIKPQVFPFSEPPQLVRSTPINFQQKDKSMERIHTSHSNHNGNFMERQEHPVVQKPQVVIREIVRVADDGNKHLIKMIERKDKELYKQAKIIKKNEQKIHDLKKRLQVLEHQNRIKEANRLAELEKSSYQRIKGFVSSMSQRLAENQELLEDNLSEIKYKKKNSFSTPSKPSQVSEPYSPPIRKHKNSSRLLLPLESLEPNPQPRVSYSNRISNEKSMKEQKYGLNAMIQNLSTSRNRLDALGTFV